MKYIWIEGINESKSSVPMYMKHYKEIPQLGHTQPLCIAVNANEKKCHTTGTYDMDYSNQSVTFCLIENCGLL